jgi:hypothetical protein
MKSTFVELKIGVFLRAFSLLAATLFLVFSCASSVQVSEVPVQKPAQEESPPPVTEPAQEEPEEKEVTEETTETAGTEEYVLSDEEYELVKKDLEELVQELNKIISARNYQKWLTFLTDQYKSYYSNPEVLRQQTELLNKKGINLTLRTLQDYFNYVVVSSRQNVQVDEIRALDENTVRAYMYYQGTPAIIYELQKVNDQWKIGIIE